MPKFSAEERARWLRLSESAVDGFIRTAGWKAESPLVLWTPPRKLLYVPAADLLVGPYTLAQAIDGGSVARAMRDLRCTGISVAVAMVDREPAAIKAALGLWSRSSIRWVEDLTICANSEDNLWIVAGPYVREQDKTAWRLRQSGLEPAPHPNLDPARLAVATRRALVLILGNEAA